MSMLINGFDTCFIWGDFCSEPARLPDMHVHDGGAATPEN
jgi:hypothetical protein